jgi:hypothetical protein
MQRKDRLLCTGTAVKSCGSGGCDEQNLNEGEDLVTPAKRDKPRKGLELI